MMAARRALRRLLPRSLALAIRREWLVRAVADGRAYVEGDVAILPRYVKRHHVSWDIGANSGMYTIRLSKLAKTVVAFEPIPHNFEILQRVVRRTKLTNVAARRMAIADVVGTAGMSVPVEGFYGGFYMAALDERGAIPVELSTIDSLIAAGTPEPDFIKCDVEGAETRVIEGARSLIERRRPMWLLETFTDDVVQRMRSLGYTAYVHIGGGELREVRAFDPRSRNYIFLADGHDR